MLRLSLSLLPNKDVCQGRRAKGSRELWQSVKVAHYSPFTSRGRDEGLMRWASPGTGSTWFWTRFQSFGSSETCWLLFDAELLLIFLTCLVWKWFVLFTNTPFREQRKLGVIMRFCFGPMRREQKWSVSLLLYEPVCTSSGSLSAAMATDQVPGNRGSTRGGQEGAEEGECGAEAQMVHKGPVAWVKSNPS